MPDGSNVFGRLSGPPELEAITSAFAQEGWSVRKSAWDEFEATAYWCSITLFASEGVTIFSGAIGPDRTGELAAMLRRIVASFEIELYDDDRQLIQFLAEP